MFWALGLRFRGLGCRLGLEGVVGHVVSSLELGNLQVPGVRKGWGKGARIWSSGSGT